MNKIISLYERHYFIMKPTQQSLTKEISRLYKLGFNNEPLTYRPSTLTETVMNLYIINKYSIKNPFHEDIIAKYKRYKCMTTRQVATESIPQHLKWEFYVYFDKKNRIIRHNGDDYYDVLIYHLTKMININPGKKITCDFNSCNFIEEVPIDGHSEIIIFDPILNVLEYIDSNNIPKHYLRKDTKYFQSGELRCKIMEKVAKNLPSKPMFITNRDIYSGYEWGIQSIECASDILKDFEKEGYCLMWCHLFGDLALAFPEHSMRNIIRTILTKATDARTKAHNINDYLAYLIRGYVRHISQTLHIEFDNDTSKKNACINLVSHM